MDSLLQRAKSFANEAAKRSQDLAKEAAKLSQDIALETAKQSKKIASEASKKADQVKALAGEIHIGIPPISFSSSSSSTSSTSTSYSSLPSNEELQKYGITPDLREFVQSLDIKTFQDFPVDFFDGDRKDVVSTSNVRKDLTEWQEKHALLVLKSVPEISKFRYELCPRVMKEKRFWKIYFTLVRSHIVLYESPTINPEEIIGIQLAERTSTNEVTKISNEVPKVPQPIERKHVIDDKELDAYLLGDSDGDGEDLGSDADFDQLVNNSALGIDSDPEDEIHDSKKGSSSTKADENSSGELI